MRLEKWKGILVEFFPPTTRTKALSHAKKESLFRAFRLLYLWKISSSKTEGQSWSRAWKLSQSRFYTETQRNALNFWECMLDRLASNFIGLNSLGHRMKLTQYSIIYCFLIVYEISSNSVKISAQQMSMNVIRSLQFFRRIVKSPVHHPYHCATEIHRWE